MSKQSLAQILNGEPKGGMEAAMDVIKAVAPGLSLSKILSEVGSEIKQMRAHGAHEMAAALFNGSGFVMYPRGGAGKQQVEDQQNGMSNDAIKPSEIEHGGMEM